eukprot:5969419-Amphidinium_carterae.1
MRALKEKVVGVQVRGFGNSYARRVGASGLSPSGEVVFVDGGRAACEAIARVHNGAAGLVGLRDIVPSTCLRYELVVQVE